MKVNSRNLTVVILFILLTVLSAVGIIVAINLQGSQAPDDSRADFICGGSGSCAGKPVGTNISYSGGSCNCTQTTGDLCACVPTGGSACTASDDSGCTSMGQSCTPGGGSSVPGTCVSNGTANGITLCVCSVGGNGGTTVTPPSCNSDPECGSGKFCNNGTCQNKGGTNASCSSNRACLSDNCVNGTCQPGGGTQCTNDSQCSANQFCGDGVCKADRGNGSACGRNAQCSSNVCLSNVCRPAGSGGACVNGQVTCNPANPGFGRLCSNGALQADETRFDACAPNVTGQNCTNLTTFSGGEPNKGRFVGCNGALNCFCPHPSGQPGTLFSSNDQNVSVQCRADGGNDSCGAGVGVTPPVTTVEPPTTTPTTPFCGDAICATNELCERTSPGGSTFRACTAANVGSVPTGQVVTECYRITDGTNQVAGTGPRCKYCGDGVFHDAEEQCDPTAPATGGNDPTTCSPSCLRQVRECIGASRSTGILAPGVGNRVIFTLRFRDERGNYPYIPGVQARISSGGTDATAVGRDSNSTGSTLVGIIPGEAGRTRTLQADGTFIYEYKFEWEAASTAGADVADGTYTVQFLNGGSQLFAGNAACVSSITVAGTQVENPLFSIVKLSTPVCESDNDSRIDYTIRATNRGPVEGIIDFVRDTLDPDVIAAGIVPTGITPTFGTYASGVITWIGSVADRTYQPNQTKEFRYTITIPSSMTATFSGTGIDNQVVVQYDTNDTDDNTDSFTLNTPLSCTITIIPETSLFDDGRFMILGALFVLMGVYVYRRQYSLEHSFELEAEKKLSRKADDQ